MPHVPAHPRWPLALAGLFCVVFAALALTGPGRIDSLDGQARYEIARGLVERREGQPFTADRLPQSLPGVPAILLADATGPKSEARRHVFFALTSPFVAGLLAVAYAVGFRWQGSSPKAAVGWAAAGVFCTPSWFYGTSTFDDLLGAAAVVWALVAAYGGRRSFRWAVAAGLILGFAFNCKQPLGLYVLPALAAAYNPERPWWQRLSRLVVIVAGLGLGVLAYRAYEWHRYPGGMDIEAFPYMAPIKGHAPLTALAVLLVSPAAGALWYCPTLLLSLRGVGPSWRNDRLWTGAVLVASAGFVAFLCSLLFFKGDVGWGPRYLTPVFAVLWLLTPAAAEEVRPGRVALYLGLGLLVQLLALTIDPHRLYIRTGLQPKALLVAPTLHFDAAAAHLFQRPRELWEVLADPAPSEKFTPAPSPTYAIPLPDPLVADPDSARRYHVFNSLRFWWASQVWLPPEERPVDLGEMLAALGAAALGGLTLLLTGLWGVSAQERELYWH
jgi:hypothetical protein